MDPLQTVDRASSGSHTERVAGAGTANEEAATDRIERLRAERNNLRQQLEADELEAEVEQLRRLLDAGATPVGSAADLRESTPSAPNSEADSVPRAIASRPRLKEPTPFKGDTIKEARNFIRDLEVIFALAASTYPTDREKVLYGVMFLAGEAHESWHQNYSINDLEGHTFEDFARFVRDAVGDPINRSIDVTLQYDRIRQKENQTVQAFATELSLLEDQMAPYTEAQRVRHLLAKLLPSLRSAIIKFHNIPEDRQSLVALAARIETTDRGVGTSQAASWRQASGSRSGESKRKRQKTDPHSPTGRSAGAPSKPKEQQGAAKADLSQVECYGCHKKGHYKTDCKERHLWSAGGEQAVRQVAEQSKRKGKGSSLAESRN